MKLRVTCPNCKGTLEANDEWAEKITKCPNCSINLKFPPKPKPFWYVIIAVVAILAEVLLYAVLGVLLGWKHAGGIVPMIILIVVIGLTWCGITKRDFVFSDFIDSVLGRS
jgi:uncharacterized membrane protein